MPPNGPKAQLVGSRHPSAFRGGRGGGRGGFAPSGPRRAHVASPRPKGSSLIVDNLPVDVSEKDVVDLFVVTVGPLTKCRLVHDDKGIFQGMALVDFVHENHAALAYDLYNGKMIDKQTHLKISLVVSSPASIPVAPPSALSNLAPFPAQQRQQQQAAAAGSAPRQPKHKSTAVQSLVDRMGPPVVSLGERLGPVLGQAVGGGKKKEKVKKVALVVPGAAAKMGKRRGAPRKRRSGGGGAGEAMVVE